MNEQVMKCKSTNEKVVIPGRTTITKVRYMRAYIINLFCDLWVVGSAVDEST